MYRCPFCLQDFLLRLDPCPGCVERESEKRRARKAKERRTAYDPVGQIDEWQFWDLLRLYPCCPCCGKAWARVGTIARDHIVPVSRGGPNALANIQPLCQACNLWKSDHTIYFDRHFPGRAAALPAHLQPFLPPAAPLDSQLSLLAPTEVDPTLTYPRASARQMEAITLHLSRLDAERSPNAENL